jgi:hypothetical protein
MRLRIMSPNYWFRIPSHLQQAKLIQTPFTLRERWMPMTLQSSRLPCSRKSMRILTTSIGRFGHYRKSQSVRTFFLPSGLLSANVASTLGLFTNTRRGSIYMVACKNMVSIIGKCTHLSSIGSPFVSALFSLCYSIGILDKSTLSLLFPKRMWNVIYLCICLMGWFSLESIALHTVSS